MEVGEAGEGGRLWTGELWLGGHGRRATSGQAVVPLLLSLPRFLFTGDTSSATLQIE